MSVNYYMHNNFLRIYTHALMVEFTSLLWATESSRCEGPEGMATRQTLYLLCRMPSGACGCAHSAERLRRPRAFPALSRISFPPGATGLHLWVREGDHLTVGVL
jgi:hypothetical protein